MLTIPGTRGKSRADLQTGHRERTGIRYNNSFGGDSEKPQSGRRDGELG
jgi:hypothetical protein